MKHFTKMKKIVFHLGLPKTGTTWLQKNVFPNMDVNLVKFPKLSTNLNGPKDITLVSDEHLSVDCMWPKNATRDIVAKRIKELYPNAYIIFVVRDKDKIAFSMWREYVECGGDKSFDDWTYDLKKCNPKVFDFKQYTTLLKTLFDNVLVLQFNYLKENPDDFVKTICDFIEVPIPHYEKKVVNTSIDGKSAFRWYKFNTHFRSRFKKTGLPKYSNPLFWMFILRQKLRL